MNNEQKQLMIEEIKEKSSNNKDKEAMIHPSRFGFSAKQSGTDECIAELMNFNFVKNVKCLGKDLLSVTLF